MRPQAQVPRKSNQTIVVGDDLRQRREWQRRERELEGERDRDRYKGQFRDHERDRQ